jgi:hypothetical protein
MLLREFIYVNRTSSDYYQDDNRYLSGNDSDVLRSGDTRKVRLTLKMLGEIRRANEAHQKERREELVLVRKMYAAPPPEAAPQI